MYNLKGTINHVKNRQSIEISLESNMFNFKREGEFPLEEGQKTDTVSGLIRF